jgi:hypothetical protein
MFFSAAKVLAQPARRHEMRLSQERISNWRLSRTK